MMEIWPLGNLGQDKSRWILRYEAASSHAILIVNSNEVPLDSLSSYFGLIYTFEPGMQDIGYVEGHQKHHVMFCIPQKDIPIFPTSNTFHGFILAFRYKLLRGSTFAMGHTSSRRTPHHGLICGHSLLLRFNTTQPFRQCIRYRHGFLGMMPMASVSCMVPTLPRFVFINKGFCKSGFDSDLLADKFEESHI